jgi:inosine/xanthosine triphosphate pyrophosphatase family protein
MRLIFASNNQHKIEELKAFAGKEIEIVSLKDAGIDIDIPEPHDTLEENGIDTKLANPYKTRIIAEARIKSDKLDAIGYYLIYYGEQI